MRYSNGKKVELGDKIDLGDGDTAIIVGIIDENLYSEEYPKSDWEYLKSGLLILTRDSALLYYPKIEDEIKLISRKAK
ncbi:hypothetical protein [Pseudomonas aeruginosa]|uniref:hypothetical protein n=1 Tax=Pseudomonas aeruginosa TaxID=287 RepID=UPI000F52F270|nr:hypothetical protein [Pseudomonas aeruginosa]